MNKSTNYQFWLPEDADGTSDEAAISKLSENFSDIDGLIAGNSSSLSNKMDKVGPLSDGEPTPIIVADANDYLKNQKFRIYNTRKLMANRIEICARHISFDLAHDWIDSISIENQPCEYALNTIFRKSQFCLILQ